MEKYLSITPSVIGRYFFFREILNFRITPSVVYGRLFFALSIMQYDEYVLIIWHTNNNNTERFNTAVIYKSL